MADVEANRALAEIYIARQLGFSVEELRDRDRPLGRLAISGVRFKRYKNHVDDSVRASAAVAWRAAQVVVQSVGSNVPSFSGYRDAQDIRDSILRRKRYVDLESLLEFCWENGLLVLQLENTPAGSKRFGGMAAVIHQRPVIALASGRDGSPWLAFYLAHEIGHIMLKHVEPDTGALVDGRLEVAKGLNAAEQEADRYGCKVLTGDPDPSIPNLKIKGRQLAARAGVRGPVLGADPGVYALIYARSNNRWGVAQNALKALGLTSGGQDSIAEYLPRYLANADLSEGDERFLSVLRAR